AVNSAVPSGADAVNPQAAGVPSSGMMEAGYPTGASADAMYYDTGSSRTGWYALAAFAALIALVVGGVLLFQALSEEPTNAETPTLTLANYTDPPQELSVVIEDLERLGFEATAVAQENGLVPPGFVHTTDPPAGTVLVEGEQVTVFFNPDPQLKEVPQVIGVALEEAQTRLESAGFAVGEITTEKTDRAGENTVLSSDPEAGTNHLQGTAVNLVVAGAPDSVPIPGFIVGLSEVEARAVLESDPYLFSVTTVPQANSTVPAGIVTDIQPGAGTLVAIGGEVTINVSSGPEPVTVPPVIGQNEARARNTLVDDGLSVLVTYVEVAPGSPDDGRVTAQSLDPGSQVDPGTEITITVGRSLEAVTTTLPPTTLPPETTTTTSTTTTTTTTTVPESTTTTTEP
ncbi:MAG: PASTA domain-containing protein, partial [Ilumatobacteraceae bacterium]